MNDNGQFMVQVGSDFDQNTYIIQDGGVPVQYEGGTIIQGDLADGNALLNEPRWIQQSGGRGGKILSNQNFLNGDLVSVNGTGLNPNTRFTPSSIVLSSSAAGTQFDQDSIRLASAVSGAGGRGRPRGRKPSRGNFPVVPIDMVRQLGIEQQVILQPTVPVAMKNKTTMCKPLLMSKLTQCNENDVNGIGLNSNNTQTNTKYIHVPVFVPVPVPVYIPVPTFVRVKNENKDNSTVLNTLEVNEVVVDVYKDCSSLITPAVVSTLEESVYIEPNQSINSSVEPLMIAHPNNDEIAVVSKSEMVFESKKRLNTDTRGTTAKLRKIDTNQMEKKESDSCKLKYSYGINAWRHWSKNQDLLTFSVPEINTHLVEFVQKIRKPTNEIYVPDSILYLCLGIQLFLFEHKYDLNLFVDPRMEGFQSELNKILATFKPKLSENQVLVCRIEEEHLWEAQQFGSFSPRILIFTVCYLLTKQVKLRTWEEHSRLSFSQLQVSDNQIILRSKVDNESYILCELSPQSKRCFYTILFSFIEKCKMLDNPSDYLYLTPLEKESKQDLDNSLTWFASTPLEMLQFNMMLNRIRIVKEVQESLLSSPVSNI